MRIDFEKLDKNFNYNPTLQKNGVEMYKSFISKDKLDLLISEIIPLFDNPIINSKYGSIWKGSRFLPGKKILKTISNIQRIKSVNILEIAIDIANLLPNRKQVKLTNIEIVSEKNNSKKLMWHTDRRKGMIRAQIYLKGGKDNSGTFQYMLNTHNIDHNVDHHLNDFEIKKLSDHIFDCIGKPGDLMIFDSFGFHGKKICNDERILLSLEFQPDYLIAEKSSIDINNLGLTKKVIDNLDIFIPNHATKNNCYTLNHGIDLENKIYPISFIKKTFKVLIESYLLYFKKVKKK